VQEIQAAHGLYDYLRDGGIIACLAFFIFAGWKEIWVWGSTVKRERFLLEQQRDQLLRERDEWKRMAIQGSAIADKAIDHAATVQKGAA
jgi:hypothetical protein